MNQRSTITGGVKVLEALRNLVKFSIQDLIEQGAIDEAVIDDVDDERFSCSRDIHDGYTATRRQCVHGAL